MKKCFRKELILAIGAVLLLGAPGCGGKESRATDALNVQERGTGKKVTVITSPPWKIPEGARIKNGYVYDKDGNVIGNAPNQPVVLDPNAVG